MENKKIGEDTFLGAFFINYSWQFENGEISAEKAPK